jgi:hypothetical protein
VHGELANPTHLLRCLKPAAERARKQQVADACDGGLMCV